MPTTVQISDEANDTLEAYIFDQKRKGQKPDKSGTASDVIIKTLAPKLPPELLKPSKKDIQKK